MSRQRWQELYSSGEIDGTALASSTTPTSIIPGAAVITLPANFFDIGTVLRATLTGRMSVLNPTPGNFTIDMRLGAVVAANGNTMALNSTASKTNVTWWAELIATCRAKGKTTAANLMFQWRFQSEGVALATTGVGTLFAPASAPAVGTGFDSTTQQTVDIFGTFSVSSASNSIQVHQYLLESLN